MSSILALSLSRRIFELSSSETGLSTAACCKVCQQAIVILFRHQGQSYHALDELIPRRELDSFSQDIRGLPVNLPCVISTQPVQSVIDGGDALAACR